MGENNNHGVSTSTVPAARPKIRIIHIIAPEIIKTDVANFRDLVQRLTGKPACASTAAAHMATTAPPVRKEEEEKEATRKRLAPASAAATSERSDGDYYDLDRSDLWMDLNPGGFLSFLEEEADVFQGLAAADDFLLPLPLGSSRPLDLVGEMYAS